MVAGLLFAVSLLPFWNLSPRWFVVAVASVTLVSLSFIVVRHLDEFLLVSYLLLLPLSSFQKWLFLDHYDSLIRDAAPLSGAISIGLTEILLVGIYVVWFIQIFVARTQPLPRLMKLDAVILVFAGANLLSAANAVDAFLSVFALVHLARHILVYFFFSRRLQLRHLKVILAAFLLAIAAESALGLFQYRTGMLMGLTLDKGQGGEQLDYEYDVPGTEGINRATGTSYDSHSFGLFLTMLVSFPLAVALSGRPVAPWLRPACVAAVAAGVLTVFVTFSRSAWFACAIVCALMWLAFAAWREKGLIFKTICLSVLALIPMPWALAYIHRRFAFEGQQNLTARYDMFPAAWAMWREHFFVGRGLGNYMALLPNYQSPGTLALPVHNVFLWLAVDTGLIGAVAFYAIIGVAMWQLARVALSRRPPVDLFALGALGALTAFVIDGLTNPEFRESLVYMAFWLMLALAAALPRFQRELDATSVAITDAAVS